MRDEERRKTEYNTLIIKVLIHLSHYSRFHDDFLCPYEVTQEGISKVLGVDRSCVSRALSELEKDGNVERKEKMHAVGMRSRIDVFFPTPKGLKTAKKLVEELKKEPAMEPEIREKVVRDEAVELLIPITVTTEETPESSVSFSFTVQFVPSPPPF